MYYFVLLITLFIIRSSSMLYKLKCAILKHVSDQDVQFLISLFLFRRSLTLGFLIFFMTPERKISRLWKTQHLLQSCFLISRIKFPFWKHMDDRTGRIAEKFYNLVLRKFLSSAGRGNQVIFNARFSIRLREDEN